jgi:hypothetical protein
MVQMFLDNFKVDVWGEDAQSTWVERKTCFQESETAAEKDHPGVDELTALFVWDDADDRVIKRLLLGH